MCGSAPAIVAARRVGDRDGRARGDERRHRRGPRREDRHAHRQGIDELGRKLIGAGRVPDVLRQADEVGGGEKARQQREWLVGEELHRAGPGLGDRCLQLRIGYRAHHRHDDARVAE